MAVFQLPTKPLDLVLAFNAIEKPALTEVAKILPRLTADICNIRLAVVLQDATAARCSHLDLGTRPDTLMHAINSFALTETTNAGSRCSRCSPEYALDLQACTRMSWRPLSTRALIWVARSKDIGSTADDSETIAALRKLGITVYCVDCSDSSGASRMQRLADATGGICLQLAEPSELPDFLTAVAYRASGSSRLQYAYECEVRSRCAPHARAVGMLSLVRRASAETVILDESAGNLRGMAETPQAGDARLFRPVKKPAAVRPIRREACTGRSLPAPLAELAWSPWRLIDIGTNSSVSRVSLLSGPSRTDAPLAVELAVQARAGAKRCPLFGRVLSADRPLTLGRLLAGRLTVRAQLRRVLLRDMRVFVRLADASRMASSDRQLERTVSYAWSSGRRVNSGGSLLSVDKDSLL